MYLKCECNTALFCCCWDSPEKYPPLCKTCWELLWHFSTCCFAVCPKARSPLARRWKWESRRTRVWPARVGGWCVSTQPSFLSFIVEWSWCADASRPLEKLWPLLWLNVANRTTTLRSKGQRDTVPDVFDWFEGLVPTCQPILVTTAVLSILWMLVLCCSTVWNSVQFYSIWILGLLVVTQFLPRGELLVCGVEVRVAWHG